MHAIQQKQQSKPNPVSVIFNHPPLPNQHTSLQRPTDLEVSTDGGGHNVVHDERAGADVGRHHQALPVNLLSLNPHVDGQGGQVSAGWNDDVCQDDGLAKVQCHKATSTCNSNRLS